VKSAPGAQSASPAATSAEDTAEKEIRAMRARLLISIIFLLPTMYIAMHHMFMPLGIPYPSWFGTVFHGAENALTFALAQFVLILPIMYVNRAYYVHGFRNLLMGAPNMDSLVGSVGDFLVQFPQLTLETYAYNRPEEWLNEWTLFFWAWWITWGAFVGMFLARISRGRTLREFIFGALVLPFSYVVMWVAIFGNSALELIRSGDTDFAETTISKPEQGLYLLLDGAGGKPVIALALFIGILFYVTSADSGALVMSSLSSRIKGEREDAAPWLRIFWATLTGVLTIAMLIAGGITILQQATLVMALPFSFILVAIMACLLRALRQEATLNLARSRAYRNRQVGFTGTAAGLRHVSWRDRLSHTFNHVSPEQARRALDRRIVPALEAVAAELGKENLEAQVHIEGAEAVDPDDERNYLGRVTLLVTDPHSEAREGEVEPEVLDRAGGHRVFRYVVRVVEAPAPSYGSGMNEADDVTVRLEVRLRGGGVGYDIMNWSADQVAHDVLDHYERWLEYLGTSSAARG